MGICPHCKREILEGKRCDCREPIRLTTISLEVEASPTVGNDGLVRAEKKPAERTR